MAELTGKSVSELQEATSVNATDLLALSSNGSSKKVKIGTLINDSYNYTTFPNGWMLQVAAYKFNNVDFTKADGALYYHSEQLNLGQWNKAFAQGKGSSVFAICALQAGNDAFIGALTGTSEIYIGNVWAYSTTQSAKTIALTVFAYGPYK